MHHVGITCTLIPSKYGIKWITACELIVRDNTYANMGPLWVGRNPQDIVEFYTPIDDTNFRRDILIPIKSPELRILQVDCPICDSWLQLRELADTPL